MGFFQFKHKIRLRSRSVTFRICCAAKFKPNDEMSVFNSVFPGIPLLSFNADGEIGWNCYSNSFGEYFDSLFLYLILCFQNLRMKRCRKN